MFNKTMDYIKKNTKFHFIIWVNQINTSKYVVYEKFSF